jgi:hypothetical protein
VASEKPFPPLTFSNGSSGIILRDLRRHRFAGGQDNVPALEAALDAAAVAAGSIVLWIHEPQAVLLSPETGIRQRLERNYAGTRLLDVQTRPGPDRVVEKLDGLSAVEHVPRFGDLRSDLDRLVSQWTANASRLELVRERVDSPSTPAGPRASRHLERLWARDETLRLAAAREVPNATALATQHQLVTPLTGAVVLERAEQYARHGLTPADPTTVPAVPEPNTAALVALAAGLWVWRRFARKQ